MQNHSITNLNSLQLTGGSTTMFTNMTTTDLFAFNTPFAFSGDYSFRNGLTVEAPILLPSTMLTLDNLQIAYDLVRITDGSSIFLTLNKTQMSMSGSQFSFIGDYMFNSSLSLNSPLTPIYTSAPSSTQIGYTQQIRTNGTNPIPVAYADIYTFSFDPGTWLVELSVKLTSHNKVVTLSISTVSNTYNASRAESRNVQNTDVVIRLTGIVQLTTTSNVYVGGFGDSATTEFNVWKTRIA
jgi:hypothetical protein